MTRLQKDVVTLPRESAKAIGAMGNDEVKQLATQLFGADRKFSGSKRSRKAKRQATSRYRVFGDRVEVYPSGDPFYIMFKGRRGGRRIYPLAGARGSSARGRTGRGAHLARAGRDEGGRRRAIGGPGGPRAYAIVGTITARSNIAQPAANRIRAEAPRIVDRDVQHMIGKVF